MPQETTKRNDPCPCGSGKKYKKCCLPKKPALAEIKPPTTPDSPPKGIFYEDDIDRLSNSAIDAIQQKRFDDAERICERLLRDFPTLIDGHDRLGMLREAQARFQDAAHHYGLALEIMRSRPNDYDPELIQIFHARRQAALAKSTAPP